MLRDPNPHCNDLPPNNVPQVEGDLEGSTHPRRKFLALLSAVGVGSVAFQRSLAAQVAEQGKVTAEMVAQAEWISGVELEEDEREEVASALERNLRNAERLRAQEVDADTVPVLVFRPDFFYAQAGEVSVSKPAVAASKGTTPAEPPAENKLPFASIATLTSMLARKQISSQEITQLYLARLKKFDPLLQCVVTLMEDHALSEAKAADERRATGKTLSALDGVPWVAKDLVAVPPWKTTWGAVPFQDQVREETATVATKLKKAGTVLMAKVTLGALAWGDEWFGGKTRNPWNPEQGSSGSSAGSASAVAAGLASFALGSETLGSIVSPCSRCRTSGLRPTFGRVSRAGCMPLAWSMDKIGPIARHVEDLALVFPLLTGQDGKDPTLVERPYHWPLDTKASDFKIGITSDRRRSIEDKALEYFKAAGAEIVELDLSSDLPVSAMSFNLGTEASTVFDDVYRQHPQADYGKWPSTFRECQFVPAIQYLRANRMRGQLIRETEAKLRTVDFVLGANDLLLTNLTGHPSLVVACGEDTDRDGNALPGVVKLTASAYREDVLLRAGQLLQTAMPPIPDQPPLEDHLAAWQTQEQAASSPDEK